MAIWVGIGTWEGLASDWPIARHDHPLMFHYGTISRQFLRISGTTAGYDPSFMAGHAKSILFPTSTTLPELIMGLAGPEHQAQAYKGFVLVASAVVPWLFLLSARFWRVGPGATLAGTILFLAYVWTDFPINYAEFGMVPYFVAVPLGLATTGAIARYLEQGGLGSWVASALGSVLVVLVHPTLPMIVAPAACLAYVVACRRPGERFPASRHLGVWLIPVVVLVGNAFWWAPGLELAATKGPSGFALANSDESVWGRLLNVFWKEPTIQSVLWPIGLPSLVWLVRRDRVAGTALAGFALSGFAWGYLAAFSPRLDFLQPGRHSYGFHAALALAAGIGLAETLRRLAASTPGGRKVAIWAVVALLAVGTRVVGIFLEESVRTRLLGPEPFLSSRPPADLRWIVDRLRQHAGRGDRVLYEEGGFQVPGLADPYRGMRFSGLLPYLTGGAVELIGGPYLHAALTTNFTQFGEGKLFGEARWGRDRFVRYAKLYRPSWIVCWTPWARAFCRANPDLIEVLEEREVGSGGVLLFGRVLGFGGMTIRGTAEVEAKPGRLTVRAGSAEVDGLVVLRYHSAPSLRCRPPVRLESVTLEDDPVPFIGLEPQPGPITIELDVSPWPRP